MPTTDRMNETDSGWNVKAQHLEKDLILQIHLNWTTLQFKNI